MTPYEVLGVRPDATQREIADAFRVLAQIYHPDRYAEMPESVQKEAARRMQELNEAYQLAKKGQMVRHVSRTAQTTAPPPGSTRSSGFRAQATNLGVPWDEAVEERKRQAAKAAEAQRARERARTNGTARARPKPPRKREQVWAGLGQALVTNKLVCRKCDSVQHLPPGWKEQMVHMDYFCSVCDRLILSK